MIEFYNVGESESSKTYRHGTCTIGAFLDSLGVNRDAYLVQPIEIIVNGVRVSSVEWDLTEIVASDSIQAYAIPGGGIFKGIGSILGGLINFAFGWILPSAKGAGARYDSGQGRQLEPASIKVNQPRLGEIVPERFGRVRAYPDQGSMARRYFASPRKQIFECLYVLGVGHYQVSPNDIRISDTPVTALGGEVSVKVYQPGQSLAADPIHRNWYTAEEVGGTSSGTAGLLLSTDIGSRTNTNPATYNFNNLTITRPSGAFPPAWGQGTVVTITYPRPYTVTTEQIGGPLGGIANVFEGFFGHTLPSFTHFGGWTAGVLADLGGGYRRVCFYRVNEQTQETTYYSGEANGTRNYTFNANAQWAISVNADTSITLQNTGGRFFESDVNVASQITFDGGTVYGEWSGQFYATPIRSKTNTIEVDFFFPSGLIRLSDEGQSLNRSVTVEVQYRDAESSTWNSVFYTYTNNTQDQIGFTQQISVPSIEPVVRVRRVGVQQNSNQIFDTVHWYGLKTLLPTRTNYPEWTTITASFESGGKLAMQSENRLNVFAIRMLEDLEADGTWSTRRATRSIPAAVRYIASTIGYTDDDLFMSEFTRLNNQYWLPRQEYFDHSTGEVTVKQAIDTALQVGFSVTTVEDGLIKPVRDVPRSIGLEEQTFSFSDQNVIGDISEEFKPWHFDDYDGVEVEFLDFDTFDQDVIRYILPGKLGIKIEKLKIDGLTNRTIAWRIAARRARANFYRNRITTLKTKLEALNARYWSLIAVVVNDPMISQSAIVLGARKQDGLLHIQSSERLLTEDGESYVMAYRDNIGALVGPFPVLAIIDGKTIVLADDAPMPVVSFNREPPHLYFGKLNEWAEPCLVQSIRPQGLSEADIVAVNYDERVYAEDDNFPPEI